MILAPISDPILRATVRRAALPDEDVLHAPGAVRDALRLGFPRLVVVEAENRFGGRAGVREWNLSVPVLAITRPTLRGWEAAWRAEGLAVSRIDDSALCLRAIIRTTAVPSMWVEGVFADLARLLGRGLPPDLRGFARRVMEFPVRYPSLAEVGMVAGLSPGALKARFRRRDLPSPARYLRWFRMVAAARLLSEPSETILSASYRMGFNSDGNFCRWVQGTSGMNPSRLRDWEGRMVFLTRMVEECFPFGSVEGWGELDGLFLRQVA